jgi:transcriptional regulator with PAS, ATPase and Fis domain
VDQVADPRGDLIVRALERHHGNRTATALGLRRTSLARLIRTLGIP